MTFGKNSGELRKTPDYPFRRERARFSHIAFLRAFNTLSSFECATHGRCSGHARGSEPGAFVLLHSNPAPQTMHAPRHTESSVLPPSFRTYGVYPCNSYENSRPYADWVMITGGVSSVAGRAFRSSGVLLTRHTAAVNQELRNRQAPSASGPKSPCRIPHGMGLPLGHPSREGLRAAKGWNEKRTPENSGGQGKSMTYDCKNSGKNSGQSLVVGRGSEASATRAAMTRQRIGMAP